MKQTELEQKMKELIEELNAASAQYYNGASAMSDHEWDQKYDELLRLESVTGITLEDSPTKNVGYETVSALKKVEFRTPALSLDKTKDREFLASWLKDKTGVMSWKLDGLTVVVTCDNGKLASAVTRGNGYVGEDVTHNAPYFCGIPKEIPDKRHIVIRGEAVISYRDFERINACCMDGDEYANPRNLASGSVRLMDAKAAAGRGIHFIAFTLVNALELGIHSTVESMEFLKSLGFTPVPYMEVTADTVVDTVHAFEEKRTAPMDFSYPYPTDGLVLVYDDIAYGESLGVTSKFPRNGIAFKWADETEDTELLGIEWSASRTGRINPVAIFQPVHLEGTVVSRATIHNVSMIRKLKLGAGDTISVYKANMIIPAIAENKTCSGTAVIPDVCPVCGQKAEIRIGNDGSEFLYCTNGACPAKEIGKFEHFVGRDYFNIRGLSGATLEKLVDLGLIHRFHDIFHLSEHKEKIEAMEGFGTRSTELLLSAIEDSRKVTFRAFFASLGIPDAGRDVAKILDKGFSSAYSSPAKKTEILEAVARGQGTFTEFEGIGEVKAKNICGWFADETNREEYHLLLREVDITDNELSREENTLPFAGMTFVVTGSLEHFSNRKELVALIEEKGGKVAGSVSSKTHYLINNDNLSGSSKNKKAMELGIPVITEQEFLEML